MNCDQISKPKFTPEQIVECCKQPNTGKPCRCISGKLRWCGRFGCWIIQPSRKIVQSFPKNNEEFNRDRFRRNYITAIDWAKNSGKAVVSEDIFIKRRQACMVCPPEDKEGCFNAGCQKWTELVLVETECLKGKFKW